MRRRLVFPNTVWRVKDRPPAVQYPKDLCKILGGSFPNDSKEHFKVLLLDSSNRPMSEPISVATGTLNWCAVAPREVFGAAIACRALSIVVAHNHPSGDTKPSRDDIDLTVRMDEAAKILGIGLVDHLIFSVGDIHGRMEPTYTSIREYGWPRKEDF